MTRSKAIALGVVLVGLTALPAAAEEAQEPVCGVHQDVLEWFKHSYRETPVSIGLAANGTVIEVLKSAEGTWTIVMTQPNGISCLMAAGEGWQEVNTPKGVKL